MATLYRASSLGHSLHVVASQMEEEESIPADFKDKLFGAFDQVMLEKLSGGWGHTHGERVPNSLRGNIRDGKVETYRFIDNVWTFDLRSAAFSGGCFNQGPRMAMSVDKVRIVAVDAKMFLSKDLAGGTDAAVATAAPALRNGSAPISVAAARELPASEESATLFDDEEDDDDFEDTEQLAQLDGAADIHTRYELNSDDDDDEDGLVQPEGAMTVGAEQRAWQTNQILAQYIKVKRTRQKWTCKLKAGIARLNGRDYAFTSCDAELVYG